MLIVLYYGKVNKVVVPQHVNKETQLLFIIIAVVYYYCLKKPCEVLVNIYCLDLRYYSSPWFTI